MKFDIPKQEKSIIKVIGVGGGGGNAVAHMFNQGIRGVDFAVCNTDAQAMENNPIPVRINLGPTLTEGRGAGSRPEVGKEACIESIDEVRSYLSDSTKMVFITAGMGGGTGTGAAPIIAKAAKEMGILTVGIVTLPFTFEGIRRKKNAAEGLEQLKKNVDSILVISNDKIQEMHGDLPVSEAFGNADDVLTTGAKSIAEIITVPGYINVDFEDVRFVMKDSGVAMMGIGIAEGENRARKAINMALNSPLLEDNDIRGAKHILLNISSAKTREVTMGEIKEITDFVQEEAGYGTDLIWGNCQDDTLGEKLAVTIIATGFETGASKPNTASIPEKKVLLEDDMQDIGSVDIISTFDNEETGVTFDFDDEVVLPKRRDTFGQNTTRISDPYVQKKEQEERFRRMEADNARREYLRKSATLSLDAPDAIEKAEKTPAYLRRGTILEEEPITVDRARSNGSAVWIDEEGTVIQSGNSFLRPIAD
jgi:cell division protein FtsZ